MAVREVEKTRRYSDKAKGRQGEGRNLNYTISPKSKILQLSTIDSPFSFSFQEKVPKADEVKREEIRSKKINKP